MKVVEIPAALSKKLGPNSASDVAKMTSGTPLVLPNRPTFTNYIEREAYVKTLVDAGWGMGAIVILRKLFYANAFKRSIIGWDMGLVVSHQKYQSPNKVGEGVIGVRFHSSQDMNTYKIGDTHMFWPDELALVQPAPDEADLHAVYKDLLKGV
jgi:hypothetical protein